MKFAFVFHRIEGVEVVNDLQENVMERIGEKALIVIVPLPSVPISVDDV